MNKIIFYFFIFFLSSANPQNTLAGPQNTLTKINSKEKLSANSFIKLYKIINPTVVNISSQLGQKKNYKNFNLPLDFPYRILPGRLKPSLSLGAGFIISADGLIITNVHVIANANIINVKVSGDNKNYVAKIIGQDKSSDIALIKINAKYKLNFAKLGSSQSLKVGQWVAAFGNPYGYSHTMTKGIISAKGRHIDELNRFPFLQTDASINKGNSGGPLVNLHGQVVGVNSAIDPRAQGIGFAIPIDNVKSILKELKKYGFVKRGFLGIYMFDLNLSLAKKINSPLKKGALIVEVLKNSPAEKGGLKIYDVITRFNKKNIYSAKDLSKAIANSKSDAKIILGIYRQKRKLQLSVHLQARPQDLQKQFLKKQSSAKKIKIYKAPYNMGFKLANGNKKLARNLKLSYLSKIGKPVVVEVIKNSPSHLAGLAYLDIILDVNLKKTQKAHQVFSFLKKGVNYIRVLRNRQVFLLQIQNL